MTVAETIQTLSDFRDTKVFDLTVCEFQAIGIAMVILASLDPPQRALIDALINMSHSHSN